MVGSKSPAISIRVQKERWWLQIVARPKEQQVDFAELQERIRQQQLDCHNQ